MERPHYSEALRRVAALEILAPFDPHIAGTPSLGLDQPESDIDILCHAPDGEAFAHHVWRHFGAMEDFSMHQWIGENRPVVAGFTAEGWAFEIFGAAEPVADQAGWRHFCVEERLLALGGAALRARVMAWRQEGMKTEPAFATALGLEGDPYAALLELAEMDDTGLTAILSRSFDG